VILKTIKDLKDNKKTIGFTASTFDLLHAGHALMLEECKNNCDFLIVGLLTDPTISRPDSKMKPIQSTLERWLQAQRLSHVDLLIPFDTEEDLLNLLNIIEPDIRFVGEEYEKTSFTGFDLPMQFYYNKRKHNYSSSKIKNKITK
jgi:glycerol-3-phosphate cytidylyltransferase